MTQRPLRVAHITATFPPYLGGTGNVCYHNARVLAERGHDVHVYTATWPGEPVDPPGVSVHRLQTILRTGNASLLLGLVRELEAFDVVHLHYPFIGSGELVAAVARLRRIPLVVTYHNDLLAPGVRGVLFGLYRRSIQPAILASAARIGVVASGYASSSKELEPMVRTSDPRLIEVPNGVDTATFHPGVDGAGIRQTYGLPNDAFVVVFAGVLDEAHHFKRLDLLLHAIRALKSANVWVLVIGGGSLLQRYKRMAVELEINERVRFVGQIAQADMPSYLSASNVIVLPSDSVESFGLVLIEAMACGRPVVASDLPGVRDVVTTGRDGLLVPPGDASALSQAIDQIAGMSLEDQRAMGAAGRQKVIARYDWPRIGEQLESIYEQVIVESVDRPVNVSGDDQAVNLPLEVRTALDVVAVRSGAHEGEIRGLVAGQPELTAALALYAPIIDERSSRLISLGLNSARLRSAVMATEPQEVVAVVAGPLGRIFRPFRATPMAQTAIASIDLSSSAWSDLGYERVDEEGVQGLGSLAWAAGERVARRINRSELADRCRIAMLRCIFSSRPMALASVRVRQYRRVS